MNKAFIKGMVASGSGLLMVMIVVNYLKSNDITKNYVSKIL